MDGSTVEYIGHLIAFSGDWKRGCDVAERARQLNPNHPGWYWAVPFLDAYRKGDYRNARTFILKGNQPGLFFMQALLTALYGQLGEREAAEKTLRNVLSLKPNFALIGRSEFGKWYLPELVEHLIDGLRKAGLEIADEEDEAAPLPATEIADTRAVSGSGGRPAIAVLPFANISADSDQEYFSDGLAEEIINLLAQVSGLKVIARTSAFAFRGKEQDIREIANALGVSSVLQGSVRRAGSRLRITAQLIDAADGGHLWAERFDREMTEVFAVQDEIAAAIASALKVTLTGQPSPARPYQPNLAAYEAFLKGRHHYYKFSPEAFTRAEQEFTHAIALDPQWAEPHAALGDVYFASDFTDGDHSTTWFKWPVPRRGRLWIFSPLTRWRMQCSPPSRPCAITIGKKQKRSLVRPQHPAPLIRTGACCAQCSTCWRLDDSTKRLEKWPWRLRRIR